jgi:D-alanyl-D-alanine carboxypeptidase/D-alanyl-D-alanine-endopeptidase (penicillin-binding protein 4)
MPPRLAFYALAAALCLAASLDAQTGVGIGAPTGDLAAQIAAITREPAVARTHWGVMVVTMDGTPIYSLNEGQLFQPASNTKLFTTAAALALIPQMTFETKLVAKGRFPDKGTLDGDLVLIGDGDANLSGRPVPYAPAAKPLPPLHFLEEMADTVAASGLKRINGDIVGDDTLFPRQPYAIDWAIDDAVWGYGAPVSALTVNDNQIVLTVHPGNAAGEPPTLTLDPDIGYYTVDASGLKTVAAKGASRIEMERPIGSKTVRVYGTIAADARPDREEIAIEDPAEYAAMAMKRMLQTRGVSVNGAAHALHRTPTDTSSFLAETRDPVKDIANPDTTSRIHGESKNPALCNGCEGTIPLRRADDQEKTLAFHHSPTVAEDVVITNKESQNLHAELLLRQLGAAVGTDGSIAQGARVVRSFLVSAGIDPGDFVFFDGSGLSGHNLVTPRAVAKLLQFASTQPWFAAYKASLPIGGVDGSLESRFTKPPLKGHVFAKTGTNSETRALSGYLECLSGRTVIFSIMAGDHFPSTAADREAMDRIVAAIAAVN